MLAKILFALAITITAGPLLAADKQEWGNLSGQFLYDGDPPKPKVIQLPPAPAALRKKPLLDESLVIDAKTKGIANIFVYLRLEKDQTVSIHPDYQKSERTQLHLRTEEYQYTPHALAMRTQQSLRISNGDTVGHIANDELFNELISSQTEYAYVIVPATRRPIPSKIKCNIHPWEYAHLLICDHPYFAITDAEGKFEIKNLPVGEWSFQVWHEQIRAPFEVKRATRPDAGKWTKARVSVALKPGANSLGEMQLSPELFKEK